jgi:Uma2 family endonuclease
MTTATPTSPREAATRQFDNGAEFIHSLGDIPWERVIWHPLPGTATERDLLLIVERDKRLCELVDGTLVEKPMGSFESAIAAWLIFYLNALIESNPIGTVFAADGMMRMFSGRVRLPDVSFINSSRLTSSELRAQPIVAFGPDLAVEVISESNTEAEISQKKKEYFESGTQLMWVIYPLDEVVEVFVAATEEPEQTLGRDGILEGRAVLPGFSLLLEKLFSKIPK